MVLQQIASIVQSCVSFLVGSQGVSDNSLQNTIPQNHSASDSFSVGRDPSSSVHFPHPGLRKCGTVSSRLKNAFPFDHPASLGVAHDRETGHFRAFEITPLHTMTDLKPRHYDCDRDALDLAKVLRRGGYGNVTVLRILSKKGPLRQRHSVWLPPDKIKEYRVNSVHFVTVANDRIYDLHSRLPAGLSIGAYLMKSFPEVGNLSVQEYVFTFFAPRVYSMMLFLSDLRLKMYFLYKFFVERSFLDKK